MAVIIDNPKRTLWVRVVSWFFFIVGAACIGAGVLIYQTYGLGAADGGVLKPVWERLAMGGFVVAFGLFCAVGMWFYGTVYVARLVQDSNIFTITTLSLFGHTEKQFQLGDIKGGSFFHGRMGGSSSHRHHSDRPVPTVNAPWVTLRLKGQKVPYVIDGQADMIDEKALGRLVKSAMKDWKKDRAR